MSPREGNRQPNSERRTKEENLRTPPGLLLGTFAGSDIESVFGPHNFMEADPYDKGRKD